MGSGNALAEIAVGPEIVRETAELTILRAPEQQGRIALLFYANGEDPVSTQILFPGLLLPGPTPSNENIHLNIPLVPSLPDAPDVAVIRLHAAFGPLGLTYYERHNDKLIAYKPRGVLLPNTCPRHGFAFTATLAFLDGTHTSAHTTVPCSPLAAHRSILREPRAASLR